MMTGRDVRRSERAWGALGAGLVGVMCGVIWAYARLLARRRKEH